MGKQEIITFWSEYGKMDRIICMDCKAVPCVCDNKCISNCGKSINIHTDPYCVDCKKIRDNEIAEFKKTIKQ